jgi:hypothetical protein
MEIYNTKPRPALRAIPGGFMDMKKIQELQKAAKEAEGELRSKIQRKCEVAIIEILTMAGVADTKICGNDISRMADTWHSGIMNLLEQINFVD